MILASLIDNEQHNVTHAIKLVELIKYKLKGRIQDTTRRFGTSCITPIKNRLQRFLQ